MKLVRFSHASASETPVVSWGVQNERGIFDLGTSPAWSDKTLLQVLADWSRWRDELQAAVAEAQPVPGQVELLCPVAAGGKLICIGLNYRDHAIESGMEIPSEPVVFNKLAGALCGPGCVVPLPTNSRQVDFEAELVMVIGTAAWQVSVSDAEQHIGGYTCGHDVSARDWQLGRPGGQWLLGKSFPGFAPVGPAITPRAEVANVADLKIQLRLNGETMQSSSTKQLIFSPAELVSFLSQFCELLPGDLIFTGTPPGVGMARQPQRFIASGDTCEVEIEGLGTLRNRFE